MQHMIESTVGDIFMENLTISPNMQSNCPSLQVLDFRPPNACFNLSENLQCDEEWPCEVREFWLQIHPFVDTTRFFLSYGSLVIIVLGIVLNALSFYILVSSGLAKNGSGIYLITLSICDSGNLLINILIGVWRGASYEFNNHFMDHEWLCRSHGVFVEVFQTISAWIVVAFTIERSLAVWYPMILRQTRKNRAKIVVASLSIFFTMFCMSKLFLTGFEKDSVFGYIPCNSNRYVWEDMAYVRVAFQTWIPTVFVFTFNCLMFWKLRKIKKLRKQLTEHVVTRKRTGGPPLHHRNQSFINKPSPTNPMLIAVSLAYLILVFPLGAVQTIELYWNVHRKVPIATMGAERSEYIHWMMYKILLKYIRSFFFGLYQLNFAINFFLYFAAGVEFRRYLQKRVRQMLINIKVYCFCKEIKVKTPQHRSVSNTTSLSVIPNSIRTSRTELRNVQINTIPPTLSEESSF